MTQACVAMGCWVVNMCILIVLIKQSCSALVCLHTCYENRERPISLSAISVKLTITHSPLRRCLQAKLSFLHKYEVRPESKFLKGIMKN